MSRSGFTSAVYDGNCCLGELETIPVKEPTFRFPNNEIRIHHLSLHSERCSPISVLQTIAPFSIRCKLESKSLNEQPHLLSLHSTCFHQLRTAVVLLGEEEIHLVAMLSKQKNYPCFWCYSVRPGLYDSCLGMLNLRCLSIVFDLDETLIVANTNKSFEDRIEVLRSWIARETDPVRVGGMIAEMKRYMEDQAFLKHYTENDSVVDDGKVYNVQAEEVPKVLESQARVVRPVIRLPEKNIVLTRINPEVRDTSVLVKLRPAWDDLRSYLIAKGRKRFEVYVCTMAERDYALEMWRLLDPDAHLIGSKQLLDRVVCVKSGARKSLLNVFKDGNCHPKMAMVIDDRMKVWDDKDQPRVHVVPAFTPYYAPQAETVNAVPVLCVARNVACNVRGGFFKEFDENLLRSISEMFYEDGFENLPSAPDVSNYMMSEDEKATVNSASFPVAGNCELRSDISQHSGVSTNDLGPAILGPLEKPSLLGAPSFGDVSLSESDPGVKKRIPMINQKLDLRHRDLVDPPSLSRLFVQQSVPEMQLVGVRITEEDMKRRHFVNQPLGSVPESDLSEPERHRGHQNLIGNGTSGSIAVEFLSHLPKSEESCHGHELPKQNLRSTSQTPDFGNSSSSNGRELPIEGLIKQNLPAPSIYIEVLQEIGERCNSKVEFRSVLSTSENLQFSVEVLFAGEKIGFGMGNTRKDAQQQAAGSALRNLADMTKIPKGFTRQRKESRGAPQVCKDAPTASKVPPYPVVQSTSHQPKSHSGGRALKKRKITAKKGVAMIETSFVAEELGRNADNHVTAVELSQWKTKSKEEKDTCIVKIPKGFTRQRKESRGAPQDSKDAPAASKVPPSHPAVQSTSHQPKSHSGGRTLKKRKITAKKGVATIETSFVAEELGRNAGNHVTAAELSQWKTKSKEENDTFIVKIPKGFTRQRKESRGAPQVSKDAPTASKVPPSHPAVQSTSHQPKSHSGGRALKKRKITAKKGVPTIETSFVAEELGRNAGNHVTAAELSQWKTKSKEEKDTFIVKASYEMLLYNLERDQENVELQARLKQLERDNDKLKEEMGSHDEKFSKLKSEKDASDKLLVEERSRHQDKINDLEGSISSLTFEVASLKSSRLSSDEIEDAKDEGYAEGRDDYVALFLAGDPNYDWKPKFGTKMASYMAEFPSKHLELMEKKRIENAEILAEEAAEARPSLPKEN